MRDDALEIVLYIVRPLELIPGSFKIVKKLPLLECNTHLPSNSYKVIFLLFIEITQLLTGQLDGATHLVTDFQREHGAGAETQLKLNLSRKPRFQSNIGGDNGLALFDDPLCGPSNRHRFDPLEIIIREMAMSDNRICTRRAMNSSMAVFLKGIRSVNSLTSKHSFVCSAVPFCLVSMK